MARTKDVIDLAKDIKETGTCSSIEDLSVVDVPIGKVHILALSTIDDSTLAVSVAADIHFFNVNSLLNKVLLFLSVSLSFIIFKRLFPYDILFMPGSVCM